MRDHIFRILPIIIALAVLTGCEGLKAGLFGGGSDDQVLPAKIQMLGDRLVALHAEAERLRKEGFTEANAERLAAVLAELAAASAEMFKLLQEAGQGKGWNFLDYIGYFIALAAGTYLGTRKLRQIIGKRTNGIPLIGKLLQ